MSSLSIPTQSSNICKETDRHVSTLPKWSDLLGKNNHTYMSFLCCSKNHLDFSFRFAPLCLAISVGGGKEVPKTSRAKKKWNTLETWMYNRSVLTCLEEDSAAGDSKSTATSCMLSKRQKKQPYK